MRPSAFETIFCATTSTSPRARRDIVARKRRRNEFDQVVARPDQGQALERDDLE